MCVFWSGNPCISSTQTQSFHSFWTLVYSRVYNMLTLWRWPLISELSKLPVSYTVLTVSWTLVRHLRCFHSGWVRPRWNFAISVARKLLDVTTWLKLLMVCWAVFCDRQTDRQNCRSMYRATLCMWCSKRVSFLNIVYMLKHCMFVGLKIKFEMVTTKI